MLTNNTYFENLKRIGHEYEAARVERQARKQQIIDTLGWDSEELKAWYAEDQAAKFPFEQGACKAYRAWAFGKRKSATSSRRSAAPGSRPSSTPTRARRSWKICTPLPPKAAR